MRKDMSKILVERPRAGGSKHGIRNNRRVTKQLLSSNPEIEVDSFKGIRKVHKIHNDQKELNENLKPLVRFLHSRIGQKWDDVYSEIMKNMNLQYLYLTKGTGFSVP